MGTTVMAVWSMAAMCVVGRGFWTPMNLIAHTLWSGAPLDAEFRWSATIIGIVVHMMMSVVLGVALAAALSRVGGSAVMTGGAALVGMVYGLIVWVVAQFVLWPSVDAAAAERFTPWVFGLGHLMYGLIVGLAVASAKRPVRQRTA